MVSTRVVSFGVSSVVETPLVVVPAEVLVTLTEVAGLASPSVVGSSVVAVSVPVVVMSIVIVASTSVEVSVDAASSSVVEDNSTIALSVVGVGATSSTSLVAVSAVAVESSVVVVSEVVSVVKSVCSDVASMVVERDRSDVIAIPSDSDVKPASLETGADVLADGTARRVVLVAATSCIVEVERSRAEVSNYMLKLHGKGQVFFVTTYQSF
jgi:hypothetical protein